MAQEIIPILPSTAIENTGDHSDHDADQVTPDNNFDNPLPLSTDATGIDVDEVDADDELEGVVQEPDQPNETDGVLGEVLSRPTPYISTEDFDTARGCKASIPPTKSDRSVSSSHRHMQLLIKTDLAFDLDFDDPDEMDVQVAEAIHALLMQQRWPEHDKQETGLILRAAVVAILKQISSRTEFIEERVEKAPLAVVKSFLISELRTKGKRLAENSTKDQNNKSELFLKTAEELAKKNRIILAKNLPSLSPLSRIKKP